VELPIFIIFPYQDQAQINTAYCVPFLEHQRNSTLQGEAAAAEMKCITVWELYHSAAVSQETYAAVLSSSLPISKRQLTGVWC